VFEDRKGKSARIAEKIKQRIGIDVSEKIIENEKVETITTENKATTELKKEETKKDIAPKANLKKKEKLKTQKK
jgi:hypothetical protein